jgi:hypothetical protein
VTRFAAVKREICECSNLRAAFGLSEEGRASQHGAMVKAYEQAVKARGEVPSPERLAREYTPISSGLKACGGHAGRDFKLIVGTALLQLTVAEGGRRTLDIIYVKTHHGKGHGYCVLVTEAGAERIMAVARSMTFEAAERARASKPPKGAETDAAKHALDALAELGLTNVLGLALPDTRDLTPEQVGKVFAAYCGIRQATVSGGDGLWAAIHTLAQAAGAPPPSLAMEAAAPPQPAVSLLPEASAELDDPSDTETQVGDTEDGRPLDDETPAPLVPASTAAAQPPAQQLPAPVLQTGRCVMAHADRHVPLCRGGTGAAPAPEAAVVATPETAAPVTTRASRKRKAGAASDGAPQLMGAVEAQSDAPVQAPPLAASPPMPEEAKQRLRDALESGDGQAAALALEALEAVAMTKATLRSTGAMKPPLTHKPTHVPPPRHLAPNRRGHGRQ